VEWNVVGAGRSSGVDWSTPGPWPVPATSYPGPGRGCLGQVGKLWCLPHQAVGSTPVRRSRVSIAVGGRPPSSNENPLQRTSVAAPLPSQRYGGLFQSPPASVKRAPDPGYKASRTAGSQSSLKVADSKNSARSWSRPRAQRGPSRQKTEIGRKLSREPLGGLDYRDPPRTGVPGRPELPFSFCFAL